MKNEQFESDINKVTSLFNKLKIVGIDGEKILKGELEIVDTNGRLWDTYSIEIRGSENYPNKFPKLFEVGDSFPKLLDWHVNEFTDRSCCVDVEPNEIIVCKNGLNVVEYIQRFAIPYFANQTFRTREGYYLYGEYSHGIVGRIEFYQNKLKARNASELISMFRLIIENYNPDRTAYCPFCRNIKFRSCHRNVFKELQVIKDFICYDAVSQIIPFLNANPTYKLPEEV